MLQICYVTSVNYAFTFCGAISSFSTLPGFRSRNCCSNFWFNQWFIQAWCRFYSFFPTVWKATDQPVASIKGRLCRNSFKTVPADPNLYLYPLVLLLFCCGATLHQPRVSVFDVLGVRLSNQISFLCVYEQQHKQHLTILFILPLRMVKSSSSIMQIIPSCSNLFWNMLQPPNSE